MLLTMLCVKYHPKLSTLQKGNVVYTYIHKLAKLQIKRPRRIDSFRQLLLICNFVHIKTNYMFGKLVFTRISRYWATDVSQVFPKKYCLWIFIPTGYFPISNWSNDRKKVLEWIGGESYLGTVLCFCSHANGVGCSTFLFNRLFKPPFWFDHGCWHINQVSYCNYYFFVIQNVFSPSFLNNIFYETLIVLYKRVKD